MRIDSLDSFKAAIQTYGFDGFWDLFIPSYLSRKRPDLIEKSSELDIDVDSYIFSFDNIGELYEIGLAFDNQISKKQLGQYYTPKDACQFMAKKTIELFDEKNDSLADVCCGTGNLIIEVLLLLGNKKAIDLIRRRRLYLYDLDKNALRLAIMKIAILFVPKNDRGTFGEISKLINVGCGNFLSNQIHLPDNTIVISNPPYGRMPKDLEVWNECRTRSTNDMYTVFMDKMATESKGAVIVSPQSFLGGSKFTPLRAVLSEFGGCVYSFDNIPCPIFIGKKKGIFNTNTINSVRAAITIVDKTKNGFRISPMIRFKASEREMMFAQLDNLLGNTLYKDAAPWTKIPKTLEPVVAMLRASTETVDDLIEKVASKQRQKFKLTVPSTPRYFVTASRYNLDRSSKIEVYAKDQESFERLYVIINSTFSYLWWRIYDGGITLSKQTLMTLPVPTFKGIADLVSEGIALEKDSIVNKMNAGRNNENIKFPDTYRKKINKVVLDTIKVNGLDDTLYSVHSNNLSAVLPYWI